MRNTRALAVAGAAVAALGLSAPAAVAWDTPSNITALPSVIARGGQLTITVDGCRNGGTATSSAFSPTQLSPVSGGGGGGGGGGKGNEGNRGGGGNDAGSGGGSGTARGTAIINSNARPGPYDITVDCNGRRMTKPQAFTVIGGVRGGIGGSSTTGATPTDVAIGGGLVAAAVVGGGVFWMRRRAERNI
ncbi:hypothetical protein [Streptomyces sp. SID5643]|uniref:hypothetical protein n=1 Tax=Streptomyces sp. SID5643 TaxID=2690307 RepID=UPI00136917B9|nr:hypothetical protein [Streptomyces sp. SID5643]MZF90810.1 hypothetical protein [Streptomyces sp. SID5643]